MNVRSLEQVFLIVGQNNFGNKIPYFHSKLILTSAKTSDNVTIRFVFTDSCVHKIFNEVFFVGEKNTVNEYPTILDFLIRFASFKSHFVDII